ncbi:MAG: YkgJ family cysteine cluster protein [Kofleriaceae bacterium]|nr:YkgJ family cysteine cluster protein [Kofleriaceae bacterium]
MSGRLGELTAKVDAFFARVETRHGDDMQCATGCSDCCHVRLTITSVEAAAVRTALASWPPERRAALAANVVGAPADHCAALAPNGRCLIYDVRPVVCRSHGAPIRMRQGGLPVIQSCHRNFTRVTPDADCVLDQETLSALTLAVDRASGGDGSRVDLASLLTNE